MAKRESLFLKEIAWRFENGGLSLAIVLSQKIAVLAPIGIGHMVGASRSVTGDSYDKAGSHLKQGYVCLQGLHSFNGVR